MNDATDTVHLGRRPFDNNGFVNTPVYRGSTVLFPTLEKLISREQPYTYGRRATPTTDALTEAIARLEGGAATILTSSGLQAVAAALLAFVEAGDTILMVDTVYQPTRKLCDTALKRLGVTTVYYDPLIGAGIKDLITPKTRLVFTESPGSQTFEVQDIPAIAAAAKEAGIWVLMDNTWASPLYFKPFEHGVDVSIQAATKYIVGHADAMLGAVTGNARAAPYLDRIKEAVGTSPGSEETYLALRGLRTLDVRLERHHAHGLDMARWLQARPEVRRVMHPALESDPGHALWSRDFLGASGLFAFILEPVSQTALAAFVDHLELFGMGYSWGGYESLILPFDPRSYRTATPWTETGNALRIHIGLENIDDLKRDLDAGFKRMAAAS
ncbi:MAG: cystathionine beta-lyase [Hyphomicrobiaceae bacterium]|nr:cystathionine beta-lyase [Hyphomicrobiaceae bacterium]MCC0008033.1 cystathionine beta-lyase [Hyphomicrobiaceae bacterium]